MKARRSDLKKLDFITLETLKNNLIRNTPRNERVRVKIVKIKRVTIIFKRGHHIVILIKVGRR